jgi:hypothetical protein
LWGGVFVGGAYSTGDVGCAYDAGSGKAVSVSDMVDRAGLTRTVAEWYARMVLAWFAVSESSSRSKPPMPRQIK